jgi:tyrosyl-tRNA synthetase
VRIRIKVMKNNFLEELVWRGLVYQATPGLGKVLEKGATLYLGIDPTGESLHLGHLLGVLMLKRAMNYGNKVIILVGGGTALVGDPSGKDEERQMVSREVIGENEESLKKQIAKFLEVDAEGVRMVDNAVWLGEVGLMEFLRDVGKYIPVNSMMDKEAVKSRLLREQGISFAEFSYQLMQAFDYLKLFEDYGCNLQIGGSDQWGNMVQGVELIRKKTGKEVQAMSFPLVVDPKTGKKFGKTEKGAAIWLDEEKTHPFEMYQFLVNVSDGLAPVLMKYFSFKKREEIESLMDEWEKDRGNRLVQKELAYEVVSLVHGKEVADQSKRVAGILFDREVGSLTENDFDFVKRVVPCREVEEKGEVNLMDNLIELGLVESKGEAKRLVGQNGVVGQWFFERYYLIRKGKKDYGLVSCKIK